ncbi:hypothetical protein K469DRAFT_703730 [Zopfia rhizophila CBS 207.26]|uniref:HD/PDEase domain-containing protein n=1 Tax=Zopfia rhizophila CBS 207.26 TaxID=1314779 RepID=A0A6A6ECE8_9PEZI|nr:hypothetical protein K469DRAFT_703730 [Zopfia rhizophila CBS 207.26]
MCPPTDFTSSLPYSNPQPSFQTPDIIPPTDICRSAIELASSLLPPPILNHSIRVYLYAKKLAEKEDSVYSSSAKHDLLFTSCILHDIGTVTRFDGTQRFEVEGADAAVAHLSSFGIDEKDAHDVWTAIALHTSPGIAERISELARLVREAVLTDFGKKKTEDLENAQKSFEKEYPRLGIEKVLGDAVVEQATRKPEKAPSASWPGILYRAHLAEPGWEGVNKAF